MRRYCFVDTNVLIYAHDLHEPQKARIAQRQLQELWETDSGTLSTQVLQEFYAVATKKLRKPLTPADARAIVADYAEWCTATIDPELILSASLLEEQHTIAWGDALIIEAALRAGATTLLSEDLQDGRRFGDLEIENPFR